jgi:hypothetical protein
MKGFQFLGVERFPEIRPGKPFRNMIQLMMIGSLEAIETSITYVGQFASTRFVKFRVKTSIKHDELIYVKSIENGKRVMNAVTSYLKPEEFNAYYSDSEKVIVFNTPKAITRGLVTNLKRTEADRIEFSEFKVDLEQARLRCDELINANVKSPTSRVKSASIYGSQLQNDSLFKAMSKGELSSITVNWTFDHCLHPIIISSGCGITPQKKYKNLESYQVELAVDIYDKLLSQVSQRFRRP